MKRVFIIEFEDHLGPMWMNKDNLESCLKTVNHVRYSDLILDIKDITEQQRTLNNSIKRLLEIRQKHRK